MPMLRRRHSNGSHPPVVIAICGMSPSPLFFGSRVWFLSVSLFSWHDVTLGIVICRRHFPICRTSGMFCPVGTFFSENLPSDPVSVVTTGEPVVSTPHLSHEMPGLNGSGVVFG